MQTKKQVTIPVSLLSDVANCMGTTGTHLEDQVPIRINKLSKIQYCLWQIRAI
jgi:hypothetical protein